MLYYTAMATETSRLAGGGRRVTGEVLAQNKGGFEFSGFNQPISAGTDGEGMQARYVVLDTDGTGGTLQRTHVLEAPHTYGKFGALKYMGKAIHFAGASPSTDPNCWFSSYVACSGGKPGHAGRFPCFCIKCIILFSFLLFYYFFIILICCCNFEALLPPFFVLGQEWME